MWLLNAKSFCNTLMGAVSVLVWITLFVRIAKTCAESAATERRRVEEARMLLELVCSSARGAALAQEFARCEEANVLIKSATFSKLRTMDRALMTLYYQLVNSLKQGGIVVVQLALLGVLLAHAPSFFFTHATRPRSYALEEYSPVAQARLHRKVPIEKQD